MWRQRDINLSVAAACTQCPVWIGLDQPTPAGDVFVPPAAAKSLQAGVYQSNAFDRSTADQFVTNVFSSFCRVSQSINTEEIFVVALVTQSSIESQKLFVRYTTQKSTVNRIMSTFNCSCC